MKFSFMTAMSKGPFKGVSDVMIAGMEPYMQGQRSGSSIATVKMSRL